MPDLFILGMNAKVYYGTAGATNPSLMTELSNVKDVTLALTRGEADVTTRANQGWRATAPTLRECEVTFQMVWKPSDAGFAAVRTAYLGNGTIALAVLTAAHDAGGDGPVGDFSITGFSRNEALEEAIVVDVTAKLAKFASWFGGAGS